LLACSTFLKPKETAFIFLDEVHNVPNRERWVRTMQELGKAKIIVSGSSSKLLAGELASVLTGRHLDIFVFPLSLAEFLYFKGLEIKDELNMVSKKIGYISSLITFNSLTKSLGTTKNTIEKKTNKNKTYLDGYKNYIFIQVTVLFRRRRKYGLFQKRNTKTRIREVGRRDIRAMG